MRRLAGLLMAAGLMAGSVGCAVPATGESPVPSARVTPSFPPRPSLGSKPVTIAPTFLIADGHGLDPRLAAALAAAIKAAATQGVTLSLTSGYRTPAQQQAIFDSRVAQYGGVAEATKWALPVWESRHVQGLAIDIGPTPAAMAWLQAHQDAFGLCRRYVNEPWHFELRPRAGCAPLLASAAEDAR